MLEPIERCRQLTQDAVRNILQYFRRVSRPVFLGQIALDMSCSLDTATQWADELVEAGLIRRATHEELLTIGAAHDAHVYVLVGRADPNMAPTH